MLTDSQLSALKLAAEAQKKATEGPWWNESGVVHAKARDWTPSTPACVHPLGEQNGYGEDAEFAAAARNADLSALLEELQAATAVVDMARRYVGMTKYAAGPSVPTAEAWLGKLCEAVEKYDGTFTTSPDTMALVIANPAPITEADCRNLISMLTDGERLKRLTNQELVAECLGSHAADYVVVSEMMDRLDPGWENRPEPGEQRTDEDRTRMKRKVLEEIARRKAEAANPALGTGTCVTDAVKESAKGERDEQTTPAK